MTITPLGWLGSILLFGIPCVIFTFFLFVVLPAVGAAGASPLNTFQAGFLTPLLLMLIAAFIAYRLEGRPWTWAGVRDRFRLGRLDRATWGWTVALVVWLVLWLPIFPFNAAVQNAFSGVHFYDQPAAYTTFMNSLSDGQTHIFGQPFTWGFFFYYLFGLFVFNILGEELWWRGYVLPRQELAFGARTWILHGVLWAAFHAFYHTTLGVFLSYLPTTLAISFVAQRTKNTWPGIIGHMASNFALPALILSRLLAR